MRCLHAREVGLALALALLMSGAGCQEPNQQPSLGLVADQTVFVGEGLRVDLVGSDPDGDGLSFEVSGLPAEARTIPKTGTSALLYWNPTITDTQPGGTTWPVVARVSDGRGGSAEQAFNVFVTADSSTPVFDVPRGVVLNLAQSADLVLLVEVKDDDSVSVDLALVEAPEGAKFETAGAKSAHFYWRPTEAQREVKVHRAIFEARDESHGAVTHALTLVLINGEKDAGCQGTAPTVIHAPPADGFSPPGTLVVEAGLSDGQSAVSAANVHYSVGALPAASQELETAQLHPKEGQAGIWTAELVVGAPPSGALVHYAIEARDNDDATGTACDLKTRLPKSGFFTAAVYPPGAPADACADDPGEPDDGPSAAPTLGPGTYPGRRLCGSAPDMVRVEVAPGTQLVASVARDASQGLVRLRLLDAEGGIVDEDASSAPALSVSESIGSAGVRFVSISAIDPDAKLGYALSISAEEGACPTDDAEPNDGPEDAPTLGEGTSDEYVLCAGDTDWFRFQVSSGELVKLALTFEHQFGDLDLELRRGPDGEQVVGTSASESSTEAIAWTANASGTVWARVYGHDGASNSYRLSLDVGAPPAGCEDDLLGYHGDPAVATVLPSGVYENLVACDGVDDWFAVDLNGGETLSVLAESVDGDPIEVGIFDDPSGGAVASDTSASLASVAHEIGPPARLYYRVSSSSAAAGYTLLQEISEPPGPCQPDRFEPNDSAEEAVEVDEGVLTWLRLCGSGDVDAFTFEAPPFATIMLLSVHAQGLGFADLALMNPAGEVIATELDLGQGAYLETLGEQAGTYTVLVQPFEATHLPYDLAIFVD